MKPVTLHDGRTVDSSSEDWRAECEARHVLNLPTRLARSTYLRRVRDRRGDAAAEALRELGLKIWKAQRAAEAWNDGRTEPER